MALTLRQQAEIDRTAMASAVRGAIAQAGRTQADVAADAGLTINTFSRRLNGWSDFTWPEINAIAGATGNTVVELISTAKAIAERSVAEAVPA